MSVFERYVSTITDAEERQNRWFFYGQDQWKATRKLTVNYGLRWEIYRPQTVTGPDGRVTPLTANGQTLGPWRRPQRGTFGTVERNELWGPSFWQWDVSFFKNLVVTDTVRAQFRAEAFNILNHVNLANPNTCVDCPGTAGRITNIFQLATMCQWQFGLRMEF